MRGPTTAATDVGLRFMKMFGQSIDLNAILIDEFRKDRFLFTVRVLPAKGQENLKRAVSLPGEELEAEGLEPGGDALREDPRACPKN